MKTKILAPLGASLLLAGGIAIFGQPRHPNLMAARNLCEQAFQKITAAQEANEWDMQGHAKKAKELLDQANKELRQATEAANKK